MFGDFGFASGRRKFMCLFRRHISNRNAARDEPHQTCTGTKKTQVLNFKVHQTCTGTKKNKSFELQSAPNLHRDKKNKKTKTFQSTWEGASIPLKFLFFFVFFVPVQVWCTLKFKTFVFFVPVQVWCTLKFKTCVFLSLCRLGELWSSIVHFNCEALIQKTTKQGEKNIDSNTMRKNTFQ